MSLKYEPASEPLHISVKWFFLNRLMVGRGVEHRDAEQEHGRQGPVAAQGHRPPYVSPASLHLFIRQISNLLHSQQ
jgi:hypothetical protein